MPKTFILDDRLQNDTVTIFETDLLHYQLMNDCRYPWIILVPKVPAAVELHDLPDSHYENLMSASRQLGINMMSLFRGHKLNVAAIGNIVRQLHLHHVVRQADDFAWPNPIWGQGSPARYADVDLQETLEKLRRSLVRSG